MAYDQTVIVVCTGNTCRSPMAEGFLKKHLQHLSDIHIISAGIQALPGEPATPEAIRAAQEFGIDIQKHVSRRMSRDLMLEATKIITMTHQQALWLKERFPESQHKVVTLGELSGQEKSVDVADPIGKTIDHYRETAQQIEALIRSAGADRFIKKKDV